MKPKDLLVPIIGIVLILFVALVLPKIQEANEEADLRGRVEALQQRADAGAGDFLMPNSPNLDSNTDYLNAFNKFGEETYTVTIFDASGITAENKTMTADELDAFTMKDGWIHTRDHYSTDIDGTILQFERQK
ncbi:MAG: hypothetical protein ABI690_07025 [Chloroflexota bacterium]